MRTLKAIMATLILALATNLAMAQSCNLNSGNTKYILTEGILTGRAESSGEFLLVVRGNKSAQAFSPFDAKVVVVFEIEETYAIVTESEGEFIFTVSNLKSTSLKKGDQFKKGTLLGEAASNDEKAYEIEVLVTRKDKMKVTCEMMEKYLAGLK